MNYKDIKPIPKYIEKRIRTLDRKNCPEQKGLRFYSYLTTIKKELVKITVAMRNKGKKVQLMKQVAVHGVYSDKCLVRDLEYCYLGIYAYRVGWYDEGIKYAHNIRPLYNDGIWYPVPFKYYNPYAPLVNKELAIKLFPYAALHLYDPACAISYLRTYLEFPQAEMLVKFGLFRYATSKTILRKMEKDKGFCKWLARNHDSIGNKGYYVNVLLQSYRKNLPLDTVQLKVENKKYLGIESNATQVKRMFPSKEQQNELLDYLLKQKAPISSYCDYLYACIYLGLDMNLPKNRMPHNFQRWHDIRIDQYHTAKALKDAEERKKLYEKFASVAEKYLPLQREKEAFVIVIARSPAELIREGDILHHCVGRMNYDQKFAREESLIFFVRNASDPDTPFVTIEYSLKSKKILQCYGDHDSKPNDSVLEFVNKKWLPYANRKLKQIAA